MTQQDVCTLSIFQLCFVGQSPYLIQFTSWPKASGRKPKCPSTICISGNHLLLFSDISPNSCDGVEVLGGCVGLHQCFSPPGPMSAWTCGTRVVWMGLTWLYLGSDASGNGRDRWVHDCRMGRWAGNMWSSWKKLSIKVLKGNFASGARLLMALARKVF